MFDCERAPATLKLTRFRIDSPQLVPICPCAHARYGAGEQSRAEFVTGDMIKPGAVVIDVGTNRVDDPSTKKGYRLVGDVKFAEAVHVAGALTPVPGGVGPMTITMLLANTIQAARQWAAS